MSNQSALTVKCAAAVGNELGEGPVWNPRDGMLYWTDIKKSQMYRLEPTTGEYAVFNVSRTVTALALREVGNFVLVTRTGFGFWEPGLAEIELIAAPLSAGSDLRFNDAAVDPAGRLWAGTMNESDPDATDGCLYRLDPDLTVRQVSCGFTISNGIGWSPDKKTMYFADTSRRVIWAYDYDLDSGGITNRRPFATVAQGAGVPDGLTVDADGFVWSAHWGGWRIGRYDPAGELVLEVKLPVENVTSCAFAGNGLDELYITTARIGLSEDERKNQALAGALFSVKMDLKGQVEYHFRG